MESTCKVFLSNQKINTHRGIYPSNHSAPLVSRPWGQGGCQKKQKTSRNSNFQVSAAVFQSELKNLQKRPKLIKKHKKNTISGRFFEVYSILAEKQRLKPKNSNSLKFSASFDTHLDPRGAILVEILQFLHFVLKFDNSGAPQNFFCFFQNKV